MKAKFVYENIHFERGVDPKAAMGLGIRITITPDINEFLNDVRDVDRDEYISAAEDFVGELNIGDFTFIGCKDDYDCFDYDLSKLENFIKISKQSKIIKEGTKYFEPNQKWLDPENMSYELYSTGLLSINDGIFFIQDNLIN